MKTFYVGLDEPSHAKHFDNVFINIRRLTRSKKGTPARPPQPRIGWIMDSGAFTQVTRKGEFEMSAEQYALYIDHYSKNSNLIAACTQDYMCEKPALNASYSLHCERVAPWDMIELHQRKTVRRFYKLLDAVRLLQCHTPIIPVLQGQTPADYVDSLRMYKTQFSQMNNDMWIADYKNGIPHGALVGVGSVCKRNGKIDEIIEILQAIKEERPDIKLHGFGLKKTALKSLVIQGLLYCSDSMAWIYHTWKNDGDHHDWRQGKKYETEILNLLYAPNKQLRLTL